MSGYHKRTLGNHTLHPETQMMSYGYDPGLSVGSVKSPIFLTSTFVFRTAQEGKDLFDLTSGRRKPDTVDDSWLVYSRFNNPNLEMLEDRLALYEEAETAAAFSSGMSAISTVFWTNLRPGDVVLYCQPLYGGTEVLLEKNLPDYGITPVAFSDGLDSEAMSAAAERAMSMGRIGLIFAETPANPTNSLVDLSKLRALSDEIGTRQGRPPPIVVDNTLLGPVYQKPITQGADIVVSSLTKYVGGHSDLIAGCAAGRHDLIKPVRQMRGGLGTQLDAHTCWMLLRSLETVSLRMERANANAARVAEFLRGHEKVESINYLGFLPEDDPRYAVYRKQCGAPGSTLSINVPGGEAGAFRMLDNLSIIKLAVSLGGTESLACHPASTTHSGVAVKIRDQLGIGESMVRLSIGIEHPDDLIADLDRALAAI